MVGTAINMCLKAKRLSQKSAFHEDNGPDELGRADGKSYWSGPHGGGKVQCAGRRLADGGRSPHLDGVDGGGRHDMSAGSRVQPQLLVEIRADKRRANLTL